MAGANRPLSPDERRAFLDKHYPFIEQGAEPPGRAVPSDDPKVKGLVWKGQTGWRTRHGRAVVRWQTGRPWDVTDALYPDGSRGEVNYTLDHGFRRRSSGPRRWIYGTIDVRADDVIFVDAPAQPAYTPPPPGGDANLERDLADDPNFLRALKDDGFARAVYHVFYSHEFVRAADLKTWSCGDRGAARLVAALRGFGESYHDYYLDYDFDEVWPDDRVRREKVLRGILDSSEKTLAATRPAEEASASYGPDHSKGPGADRTTWENLARNARAQLSDLDKNASSPVMLDLRAHLARLGWRTVNEDDERRMAREAMARGLDLLHEIERLEARPDEEPSAWAEPIQQRLERLGRPRVVGIAASEVQALSLDQRAVRFGLGRRIDLLAVAGRISEIEYKELRLRSAAVDARIGRFEP